MQSAIDISIAANNAATINDVTTVDEIEDADIVDFEDYQRLPTQFIFLWDTSGYLSCPDQTSQDLPSSLFK